MRPDVEAVEGSKDQLAWLVLRLIADDSPCAETSLFARVFGGALEAAHHPSNSHAQGLICDALRKLKSQGLIEFVQEQVAITDVGRNFLGLEASGAKPAPKRSFAMREIAVPAWLAQWMPRARSLFESCVARCRSVAGPAWQRTAKASQNAGQAWRSRIAPKIGPATDVVVRRMHALGPLAAKLGARVKDLGARPWNMLSKSVPALGRIKIKLPSLPPPRVSLLRRSRYEAPVGGTLAIIFMAGILGLIWTQRDGGSAQNATEAVAVSGDTPADPVQTASITPGTINQPALKGEDSAPAEGAPPKAEGAPSEPEAAPKAEEIPVDPVVAAVRAKLKDSSSRSGASENELAALEAFYAEHGDAAVWMTDSGFSEKAKAIITEIEKSADWGLPQDAFDLPSVSDTPTTPETKAEHEIKLDLAILKYARFAGGGRLTPQRVSVIFDQKPAPRDPKAVLADLRAASKPEDYLRGLHPKHEQFEQLRQALIKAREDAVAKGKTPETDATVQRLVVNMERWRWMPPTLGSYYVWNNVPSFSVRVVSDGKTVYTEKAVVGQYKYATPIFSADMKSIAFNPEWNVPETIKREDLQPRLRQGGLFGPDISVLREHRLTVSYQGKPVDPTTIDWSRANIHQFTFTQPPGPDNVLGKLKFNFPNKHAIYMHDTVQPEFFDEKVRSLSHGCIRVKEPDRLAQLLLARDKGWSGDQVRQLLARGNNSIVTLNQPVPVHLTYFTMVVDEQGKMQTLGDVYGLDSRMSAALFEKGVKFGMPTVEVKAAPPAQPRRSGRRNAGGGLEEVLDGLFGN
jgi:L,D-transpeptidase YcbB